MARDDHAALRGTWSEKEEKHAMNVDSARSGFQNLVEDVKERAKAVKDRGPRAALGGILDDVQGTVTGVIRRVTGPRDAGGPSETERQADQRRARESGKLTAARANAAKQAAEQELAGEGHVEASRTRASKRRAKQAKPAGPVD
jgi:hypothetical protein